jgi:hypothetical protein
MFTYYMSAGVMLSFSIQMLSIHPKGVALYTWLLLVAVVLLKTATMIGFPFMLQSLLHSPSVKEVAKQQCLLFRNMADSVLEG